MLADQPREKTIFCEALEHPAGPERLAYLDGACRENPELRAAVDDLLQAHDRAGTFLGSAARADEAACGALTDTRPPRSVTGPVEAAGTLAATINRDATDAVRQPTAVQSASAESPGSRIGAYKLLQEIGHAGMGAVFMAQQERPVRRRVALKVIKAGMDTAQVVARFEAERQALALMDHPNIARVFDAGTTDSGRPYFVMELVSGIPLTQFCDEARLSARERMELFIPVCQAIQHAHQRGIIHRDVKPSNVLVTLVDAKPVPKVIDFGIAKATDQRLTEKTLFTQFGSIIGTLEYMSPEQADLPGLDVDTRSDIYSLGVLLYELLTGSTPLERERLREAGYVEILMRIKEEEPPKPSTRLSSSGPRLASIAAVRGAEPARLARAVRGEVDWIVMKALEKSRARRYETASAFARDIERYLEGDPVEAGPPRALYRATKFARKHRRVIATAAVVVGVLVAATAFSSFQAVRARAAEERARAEANSAQAINNFLTEDLLTQAEPENNAAEDHVTLLEVLDRAAGKVGERFADEPDVADALRRTIAQTYHGLGSWEKAEQQWRAAYEASLRRYGADEPHTLEAALGLTHILVHRGHVDDEVLALAQHASSGFARALGPDDPATLTSRGNLALAYLAAGRINDGLELYESTLRRYESTRGVDHADTLATRSAAAAAYATAGRHAEAIALLETTMRAIETKRGSAHIDTCASRHNLAECYRLAGRAPEAIKLHEANLKLRESRLGPNHPDALSTRSHLALALNDADRLAEAIALDESTLKLRESIEGPDHPSTLQSRNNLGADYLAAGRVAEAIVLFDPTLKLRESKLGPDHPDTLQSRNNLAAAYFKAGRTAEAVALQELTVKRMEAKLGRGHPTTLTAYNNLAAGYRAAGHLSEAVQLYGDVLKLRELKLGHDHPQTIASRASLSEARAAASQPAKAGANERGGPEQTRSQPATAKAAKGGAP